MKCKTSITLSEDIVKAVDRRARRRKTTRSELIETAVRAYLRQAVRDEIDARDVEIIDRRAKRLNREAADALRYQEPL
jgi:metal-responsive CopG/Arc/MetJ family transcriptional regulator